MHEENKTLSPLSISNHSESPNPHAGSVREQKVEGVQLTCHARCPETLQTVSNQELSQNFWLQVTGMKLKLQNIGISQFYS